MLIFISCHCKFVQYNGLFFQVVFANTSIELSTTNLYRMAHIMFPPTPEVSFISNFDSMFLFIINDRISKYSIILIFTSFFPLCRLCLRFANRGSTMRVFSYNKIIWLDATNASRLSSRLVQMSQSTQLTPTVWSAKRRKE